MRVTITSSLAILATTTMIAGCSPQFQKEKMGDIIHDYLMENPEVIRDAMIELGKKEKMAQAEQFKAVLAAEQDALFNDPRDHAVGPKDAKVQVVEFYDYRCGYCRQAAAELPTFIKDNPDVRFVFKELPVLGGPESPSYLLALASSAASRQTDKFMDFHTALMGANVTTEKQVHAIAKAQGLDVQRLKADMKDPAHKDRFMATFELAQKIGANGTPTFVINDTIYPGWNKDVISKLIADFKAGGPADGKTQG